MVPTTKKDVWSECKKNKKKKKKKKEGMKERKEEGGSDLRVVLLV